MQQSILTAQQLLGGTRQEYDVKTFTLDTARTDFEILVEGDFLHGWTDGNYATIAIRLNTRDSDGIYLNRRNPIATQFFRLYLTHDAQTGKTLDLFIGKEASASAWPGEQLAATGLREALSGLRKGFMNIYQYHPSIPRNLNDFFVNNLRADLNQYWTGSGIEIPPGNTGIDVSTAYGLAYPQYTIKATWPALAAGQSRWMGLELGGTVRYGMVGLLQWLSGGVERVNFATSGYGVGSWVSVLALLPADYQTADHIYTIKVNKWGAELFVDGDLIALQVWARMTNADKGLSINGPPYGIIVSDWYPTPTCMPAMLEPSGAAGDVWPISYEYFRYAEGDPCPPRRYPLYDAGTLNTFAGLVIAAGSETSHPFPTFGYGQKTIYLKANQAGSLAIELLSAAGNWCTWTTTAIVANDFRGYMMESQAVLARVTFTPSAYPCTISDAEVIM